MKTRSWAALLVGFVWVAVIVAALAYRFSGAGQLVLLVTLALALVLWERGRYRGLRLREIGPMHPTDERFYDPVTGKLTTVFYDPASGRRDYRS